MHNGTSLRATRQEHLKAGLVGMLLLLVVLVLEDLAVSGLLVEKVGGPSVKPYQPEGLWQELQGGKGERTPRRRYGSGAGGCSGLQARSPTGIRLSA
jgi:hypothetical protein